MQKLVRIEHTHSYEIMLRDLDLRVEVIQPAPMIPDPTRSEGEKAYEFFLVDEEIIDELIDYLTNKFPGREVTVWALQSASVCPAGPCVTRKVTADGLLPS